MKIMNNIDTEIYQLTNEVEDNSKIPNQKGDKEEPPMKSFKLILTRTGAVFFLLGLCISYSATSLALDYDKIRMELDIMSDIMKRAVENDHECDNCRIKIKSQYLAAQGAVFEITRSGQNRFFSYHFAPDDEDIHIPQVPAIPGVAAAINIDDILVSVEDELAGVEDELADIERELTVTIDTEEKDPDHSFWSWSWSNDASNDTISDEDKQRKNDIQEISRERRALAREIRQYEREIRELKRKDDDDTRKQQEVLEKKLAETRERHAALQKERADQIKIIRIKKAEVQKERAEETRRSNEMAQSLVMGALCEYQATLKNLPKDEHVSLIFEGMEESRQSRIFVFKRSALNSCRPAKEDMENNALKYLI